MAGAVPELAAAELGSEHHLWVAKTCWSWFCWLAYQTQLINEQEVNSELSSWALFEELHSIVLQSSSRLVLWQWCGSRASTCAMCVRHTQAATDKETDREY